MSDAPPRFEAMAFAQNLVVRGLIGMALLLPYRWRVAGLGWLMARVIGPLGGYRHRGAPGRLDLCGT